MRYVDDLDADAYLDNLPRLAEQLPPGARAFATDPAHYDFTGLRCVKDLTVGAVRRDEPAGTVDIRYTGNPWKHDEDLVVRYTGVTRVDLADIGPIRLDELLPAPEGCRHEVAGLNGTIVVVCADLTASWQRVPRDDDPPPGSWTPLLYLGDRWNWLGRSTADGAWVVGVPHRRAEPVEDRMDALLHVLARPWREARCQWPDGAPPLDGVVRHAISEAFDSWPGWCALDWLERGYPLSGELRAALQAVRRGDQTRRKRASALLRRHEQ
ncbi:hypothetical protein Daura_26600 [Dactylosporangium aurantiacum]|uniref:Uncharacterized protein n=1 Tax=Dactylosporangium aurantiacum TaxID=35754 RepID=A0A9Q9I8M6_9ACTN|nr:hypothetical protein [Dactylosporangium aurantiacum]MDG6106567.1 hypothetical protein [Dactylosporangium aurantiacum]UWZ50406.1 hypothetical protein Daura_26600 [Dactylosporangium aurantiacum]